MFICSSIFLQGDGQHIYNENKVKTTTISGPYHKMPYKASSSTLIEKSRGDKHSYQLLNLYHHWSIQLVYQQLIYREFAKCTFIIEEDKCKSL